MSIRQGVLRWFTGEIGTHPTPCTPKNWSRKLSRGEKARPNEYAIRFNCYNCKKGNRLAVTRGVSARGVLDEHKCWFCDIWLINGSALMPDPVVE